MPEHAPYLQKHILVCHGESCGPQGADEVRDTLKKELRARDVRKFYRDGACTCTGLCHEGVNAVIWPEGTWLAGVVVSDVPLLVSYLQDGKKSPRLCEMESLAQDKIKQKM